MLGHQLRIKDQVLFKWMATSFPLSARLYTDQYSSASLYQLVNLYKYYQTYFAVIMTLKLNIMSLFLLHIFLTCNGDSK